MTTLAPSSDYTSSAATQGNKKTFVANLRTFIADLFGTDSTKATARTVLGVSTVKDFDGFIMSTAGSSATMTIGAGEAMDAANTDLIVLTSSIAKTTGAWVVGTGNGGKAEAGAVANNTWYHFYAIKRPDTGVEDVCFSTSPPATGLTAASYVAGGGNVPAAYTQYRWVGSGLTNGSAHWVKFIQNGDHWTWDSPNSTDIYVTDQSTLPILRTLPTPLGIKALAKLSGYVSHTSAAVQVKLYDPALGAQTLAGGHHTALVPSPSGYGGYSCEEVMTNTSSQIYSVASAATTTLLGSVVGYTIRRGRDA